MRAGRAIEGSEYLLSGAREAMLAGAARDAESALLSGIRGVEPSARMEATLCLAEVFLELDRPNEAIELLQPLVTAPDTNGTRARLLHVQGQLEKAPISAAPEEIERVAGLLYGIASASTDRSVRARAVTILSGILRGGEPTDTSMRLIELGLSLPVKDLPPADAVGLLAALAKHHYVLREFGACEELLNEAICIADSVGLRNSDYLQALNGLGAVACAEGRYEKGLERSIQLFAACTGIGTDKYLAAAIGNSALSLLRLGRYRDAKDWAARLATSSSVSQSVALSTLDIDSLASAMLGNREPARRASIAARHIAEAANDSSISRRALLSVADALWLAGDTRRAREAALEGLEIGSPEQDDPSGMGRFGRWLASNSVSGMGLDRSRSASVLRNALSGKVDQFDRAEMLGALSGLDPLTSSEQDELRAVLAGLPQAIPEQLGLLGVAFEKVRAGLSVA
jgi:tetratricopeptide (TPR) repeat protein